MIVLRFDLEAADTRRRRAAGLEREAQRIPVSQFTTTDTTDRAATVTWAGSAWQPRPGPGVKAVAQTVYEPGPAP